MNEVKKWTTKAGLPATVMYGPMSLLGYVDIPKGHPLHGKGYNDIEGIEVHGGLTYAGPAGDDWRLGFDDAHYLKCEDLHAECESLAAQLARMVAS